MHSNSSGTPMDKASNQNLSGHALLRFLLVVFGVGALAQLMMRGGVHPAWALAAMWAPTTAALVASSSSRRRVWAAIRRPAWRWLPFAFLLGVGPRLVKAASLWITGNGAWDAAHLELSPDRASIKAVHHLGTLFPVDHQSFALFALNVGLSIAIGACVVALIGGVGEELGWRAVLQPELERRFGRVKGTFLVGLIWAYWHLPANLAGYNDGQHPRWNALVLFPAAVVAVSFGLAWLTRRSESVWPAALAHGANNTVGQNFLIAPSSWAADSLIEIAATLLVYAPFIWAAARRAQASSVGPVGWPGNPLHEKAGAQAGD